MTEREQDHRDLTADEIRALAALKATASPQVPAEVRARARRAFLSGEWSGPPGIETVPAVLARRTRVPWRRAGWVAAGLAAIAATVIVVRVGLEPVGRWQVTDAVAPEGIELPAGAGIPTGTSVPPLGARPADVRVGKASELEVEFDSSILLRLLSGTEATLPAPPARWFRGQRTLDVRAGEIFGATSGPLGFRLHLSTPEAEAVLSGTTFAVIRNQEATCFCLYRGRLDITARSSGRPVSLPLEHRVLIYRDGRTPRIEPITDRERMKLSMMDAATSRPVGSP